MISVTIDLDTSRFDRMMSDFPGAMARAQRQALQWIGEHVASDTSRAFKSPSLRPAPRAPRKSGGKHPLLIKHPTSGLWKSFGSYLKGTDRVVVYTDKEYAGYHQFGTKKMPARPFFPFDRSGRPTPRIMRKIKADIDAAYGAELRKLGGH